MSVPANVIVGWPSTAASIPAGWVRETALDSRYIAGAATGADGDPTTDQGFATHTHTSPSHTPIQNPHSHEFDANGDANLTGSGSGNPGTAATFDHTHPAATGAATTATNQGVAITVNATSNDLAFMTVIWIKSDGTPTSLPSGCVAFFDSDTLPANWSRVAGDTYLKGAATGADGGTTGGSNTHTHTSPAHTHLQNAHSHAAATSSQADFANKCGGGGSLFASGAHTHDVTLVLATATNQAVTTTLGTSNHEPPFKKLNIIKAAANDLPTSIIAVWLGANSAVPSGWSRYTGMDSTWLKGAAANGQVGTTGGATQHTHTATDCLPIQDAHTHSYNSTVNAGTVTHSGSLNQLAVNGHIHSWNIGTTVATNQTTAVSIDNNTAGSAFPSFRTVIFIQFTGVVPTVTPHIVTTYDVMWPPMGANMEVILGRPTPEQQAAITRGDFRHAPPPVRI